MYIIIIRLSEVQNPFILFFDKLIINKERLTAIFHIPKLTTAVYEFCLKNALYSVISQNEK